MSTIAYDGKSVAYETQCGWGNRIEPFQWHKVREVRGRDSKYRYAGGCGELDIVEAFIAWIKDGKEQPYPELCKERSGESTFIAIDHDGVLWEYERRGSPVMRVAGEIYAIGSGAGYAMGAMHAGATAAESIVIASRLDPYSNDDVHSFELGT